MTIKEELTAKKEALAALKEAIENNDAEAIAQGEQLQAEIETKSAEIEQAEKKAALLNVIGKEESEDDTMEVKKNAASLGENFVENIKGMEIGKKFDLVAPVYVKAATDTQTSPAGAVGFATAYDKNVVVRYTTDNWNSYTDTAMSYVSTNSNGTEDWAANIKTYTDDFSGFEFCVYYEVNGQTYWANNFNQNYDHTYYVSRG